jgi:hypothetical protein
MKLRMKVAGQSKMGTRMRGVTLHPVEHESTKQFFGDAPINGSLIITVSDDTADELKEGMLIDVELTPIDPPQQNRAATGQRPAGAQK